MDKIALLIADDDGDVRRAARLALAATAEAREAASLDAMDAALAEHTFDAVLLDMNFALGERSGRDGLDRSSRPLSAPWALEVFSQHLLQRRRIQGRLRQ